MLRPARFNVKEENMKTHTDTDLCIVGGAGAGLCAAVRAAQCGVKHILVLDK